jgi:hypothetical protein
MQLAGFFIQKFGALNKTTFHLLPRFHLLHAVRSTRRRNALQPPVHIIVCRTLCTPSGAKYLTMVQLLLLVFTIFEVLEGPIHGGNELETSNCNSRHNEPCKNIIQHRDMLVQ